MSAPVLHSISTESREASGRLTSCIRSNAQLYESSLGLQRGDWLELGSQSIDVAGNDACAVARLVLAAHGKSDESAPIAFDVIFPAGRQLVGPQIPGRQSGEAFIFKPSGKSIYRVEDGRIVRDERAEVLGPFFGDDDLVIQLSLVGTLFTELRDPASVSYLITTLVWVPSAVLQCLPPGQSIGDHSVNLLLW